MVAKSKEPDLGQTGFSMPKTQMITEATFINFLSNWINFAKVFLVDQ